MRDLLYSVSILNYLDLSSHVESCDNVNYNTVVHKDSQNRRRDILIRAWAQTLSARPRNKKSRETDSSPGGVGC